MSQRTFSIIKPDAVRKGYTAAILEASGSSGGDALRALASDLESIEQLVLGNAALNAALTDTTMRGDRKSVV